MNRRKFLKLGLAVGGLVAPVGFFFGAQSNVLEISRQMGVLPGIGERLRVVAISDLHGHSYYLSISDLVEIINGLRPDIFILVGDVIDRKKDLILITQFAGVKANLVKLAVLGNWEYQTRLNADQFQSTYESAGFHLLVNSILNHQNLTIYGLDDLIEGEPDFFKLDNVLSRSRSILFISHCPAAFDRIRQDIEASVIAISGHTHGGQIAPFGNAIITPNGSGNYVHGWYRRANASMYVTRGVGTSGIPVRIGARPEILVLDLEKGLESET